MTASEHHQRGVQLFEQKQFAAALREFSKEVAEEETSGAWNDWGTTQLACGNGAEAERGYRRAVQLDGRNFVAITNLVTLLGRLGRPGEALPYLEAAAADLDEPRQRAVASLVEGLRASLAKPLTTVEAFIAEIGGDFPASMKREFRTKLFDSSAFVKACLATLRRLPESLWPSAIEALTQRSQWSDYRFGLVVALVHLEAGDHKSALPFLRAACGANVNDLYAQNLCIEAEVAVVEAEGRTHPGFSGLREYLTGSFCGVPWQHLELGLRGDAYLCCEGWLPVPIGNAHQNSTAEIWNSDTAQKIRKSILDGSFTYCSKMYCPYIAARTLPKRTFQGEAPGSTIDCVPDVQLPSELQPAEHFEPITKTGPRKVVLSADRTCNLACPSCRNDFIYAGGDEQKEVQRVLDGLLPDVLKDAHQLCMDGVGEVFVSKPYRRLLKQITRDHYPSLRFSFITNGLLFNRRTFEEFDLKGRVVHLKVSIDAATEETYRIVRRGGDFSRLLSNLTFIDELRRQEGESFPLQLAFVVSALNFREMPEFVRLGKRFNANIVDFSLLGNLGHLSPERFDQMNVASPNHPYHRELLEVLKAPEFDDPTVVLGNVTPIRLTIVPAASCATGA